MATEKLEFDILVNGKPAVREIKKVGKAQDELEIETKEATKGMGDSWVILGAAIAAVTLTVQKAVALAGVQVKAEIALTTALKLNTNAIDKNAQNWLDYAETLQNVSTTGDELIIQQLALLNTLGLTDNQMKAIITTGLDLAAATGTTLESAVRNLAKTLSGLQGELGESIPALKKLTVEELKAGKAIELVSSFVKGQAKAFADTDFGKLEQAVNTVGDKFEDLGKTLLKLGGSSGTFFVVNKAIQILSISISGLALIADLAKITIKNLFGFDVTGDIKSFQDNVNIARENLDRLLGKIVDTKEVLDDSPFEIEIVALTQEGKFAKEIKKAKDIINKQLRSGELSVDDFLISVDEIDKWSTQVQALLSKGLSIEEATKRASEDFDKLSKTGVSVAEAIGESFKKAFADDLSNALSQGKFSFKDFANSVIGDLTRIIFKAAIIQPLTQSIGGLFGGGGGGGGFLSGIGSFIGGLFSKGDVFKNGSPQKFDKGGIPNVTEQFAKGGLPRGGNLTFPMANGGVGTMNEKSQEAILPLERTTSGKLGVNASGMGGGGTTIVNKVENIWTVQAIDASSFVALLVQERDTIEGIVNTSFGNNGKARLNL